jgi:hypothetical protein
VAGAVKYAEKSGKKENILVLCPTARRVPVQGLQRRLDGHNGFLDESDPLGTVAEMLGKQTGRKLIAVSKRDSIRSVIALLKEAQHLAGARPRRRPHGRMVAEVDLLKHLVSAEGKLDDRSTRSSRATTRR